MLSLVAILIVGTNVEKGVPRPVLNNITWQPAAPNAVEAIKSFPGPSKTFSPLTDTLSP